MCIFVHFRLLSLVALLGLAGACSTVPADRPAQGEAWTPSPLIEAPGNGARQVAQYVAAPASRSLALTLPVQAIRENTPPPLIDLTVAPDDLWQRIRHGFGMPDLHDPLVAERQSWYLNRPDMLRRIFSRGSRYLYHIVGELEKRGMPTELALLPMVESAFNPHAVSSARAMGIWQFIPSTGKSFALDQNWWVDERRDIIASTDAALTYLQKIYEMHGDWHLALASYNWGEGAVGRAIAKNRAKGLPTDYSSLTMPGETRYYVPKLQALKNIIAQPEVFGFRLGPIPNQPYFETMMKPERIDVAVAARLAEIPIEEFVSLNPAYHRPVMNSHQAGPLVLPAGRGDTFRANLERYAAQDKPLSNWLTYPMKRGDKLARVAAQYKISEARLRQINGITPKLKLGPGFTLLVPRPGSQANPDLMARTLPQMPPEKIVSKSKVKPTSTRQAVKPTTKQAAKKTAKPQAKKQRRTG
ncbi:MAG: transglycosylase SLT domain-containing protein [Rhodocyclaceae bacterium]|nr:transglycosylase SLT domain-containing protein [Rhodocyclaceae bacterium]